MKVTIACHKDDDAREFERDLQEHQPPSRRALEAFDPRFIITLVLVWLIICVPIFVSYRNLHQLQMDCVRGLIPLEQCP